MGGEGRLVCSLRQLLAQQIFDEGRKSDGGKNREFAPVFDASQIARVSACSLGAVSLSPTSANTFDGSTATRIFRKHFMVYALRKALQSVAPHDLCKRRFSLMANAQFPPKGLAIQSHNGLEGPAGVISSSGASGGGRSCAFTASAELITIFQAIRCDLPGIWVPRVEFTNGMTRALASGCVRYRAPLHGFARINAPPPLRNWGTRRECNNRMNASSTTSTPDGTRKTPQYDRPTLLRDTSAQKVRSQYHAVWRLRLRSLAL